ncbi:hypothetical protein [Streptodolium elevatio]|uniref:Integral membrane protein n=1 Tax=Streptodolium elevatio TaxID=3157996 RepID=A0ABV3DPL8_9ACTN
MASTSGSSDTPDTPDTPDAPKAPDSPTAPSASNAPEAPRSPDAPGTPDPAAGEREAAAGTPKAPSAEKPLSDDERAELDRLRKRTSGRVKRRVRTAGSVVVLTLACLLALLSVVAVWADDVIEDTDTYVATVAPLAHDPAVQNAVTNRITTALSSRIDMDQVTDALADTLSDNGLPSGIADQLRRLSGPLESGVESFVRDQVEAVVQSDAFADLWTTANRDAHAAMVKALTGQGNDAINIDGGTVTLQLGPIIAQAQQRLVDRGFSLAEAIPEVDKSIVLVQSDQLDEVRTYVRILHAVGWWLPLIALAVAALGLWIAPNSRRAFIGLGFGVLAAMLLLVLALLIGRRIYLDRLPSNVEQDAAKAVFDALVKFLRHSAWTLAVIGAVTALTAFLFGPSRPARTIRRGLTAGLGAAGRTASDAGVRTGAAGSWIAGHRHPLYLGVIALGGLWLFLWNDPTVGSVLLVAVLVALVLAVLETVSAASAAETAATTATAKDDEDKAPRPDGGGATTWEAEDTKSRTPGGRTP